MPEPTGAESDEDTGGAGPEPTSARIPALDGIRALGIVLVLLFHGGFGWAGGGFFGVDVFFVLSGFLITGLLLSEFRRNGHIGLRRFWGHRVRRLAPALLAMLLAVAAYAVFLAPADTLGQLRGDAVATLLYANNWRQIATGQGYFAALATPRPLLHTWSLSIEEQFYVVWPLVVLAILHWTRSTRVLLAVTVAGAVASAAAMSILYHGGSGQIRVYYGTDTRAQALLIGAALAIVMAPPLARRRTSGHGAPVVTSLIRLPALSPVARSGVAALGAFGLATVLAMAVIDNATTAWMYHGGFALIALATAGAIASVALVPTSPWARALTLRPVRYVGAISYGLYLWHWPIFVVLDHARTGLVGWPLFLVRVGASSAVAVVSFHFLEMPIRRGALRGWRAWTLAPLGVGGTVAVVLAATAVPAAAGALPSDRFTGLPPGIDGQLVARKAFTTDPVRFMLFGDSVAVTLEVGLMQRATPTWGVDLQPESALGCDLDPNLEIRVSGKVGLATQGCRGWQTKIPKLVAEKRPAVVGLMLGRWETTDHLYQGKWTHIGEPVWDDHLQAEFNQAIGMFTAEGAKVMLFTMPYLDAPEAPDGSTYPENQPVRVDAYNALVRKVAASHPGVVSVFDLNRVLDPQGHYTSTIDGITVRLSDGIHLSPAGGLWLRPRILPAVDALALDG